MVARLLFDGVAGLRAVIEAGVRWAVNAAMGTALPSFVGLDPTFNLVRPCLARLDVPMWSRIQATQPLSLAPQVRIWPAWTPLFDPYTLLSTPPHPTPPPSLQVLPLTKRSATVFPKVMYMVEYLVGAAALLQVRRSPIYIHTHSHGCRRTAVETPSGTHRAPIDPLSSPYRAPV